LADALILVVDEHEVEQPPPPSFAHPAADHRIYTAVHCEKKRKSAEMQEQHVRLPPPLASRPSPVWLTKQKSRSGLKRQATWKPVAQGDADIAAATSIAAIGHFFFPQSKSPDERGKLISIGRSGSQVVRERDVVRDDRPQDVARLGLWCSAHTSKKVWDVALLVVVLYSAVETPYSIAFDMTREDQAEHPVEDWGDDIVTLLFLADLLLSFNTAHEHEMGDYFITNRAEIARHYLSSWFLVDLVSSLPWEHVLLFLASALLFAHHSVAKFTQQHMPVAAPMLSSEQFQVFRILRIVRMIRLLRLYKMVRNGALEVVEEKINISLHVLSIFYIVFVLLYITHLFACSWYFIGMQQVEAGSTEHWISKFAPEEAAKEEGSGLYLRCMYWAILALMMSTSDISPTSDLERGFSLFVMVTGALVIGYLISSMIDLAKHVNESKRKLEEKLSVVREFCRVNRISPRLTAQLRGFYEFYYVRQSTMEEQEPILQHLTGTLRRSVETHLLGHTVSLIPMFRVPEYADVDFQLAVHPLLKPVVFGSSEVVSH
jgi:hypothetical protein